MRCRRLVCDAEREADGCAECADTRTDRRRVREVSGVDGDARIAQCVSHVGSRREFRGGGAGGRERSKARSAPPSEIPPVPRAFVPVGERRDISATNEEPPKSDRGALGLVQGSRDERGRREFTLALGSRRPKATLNVDGVEAAPITRQHAPVEQRAEASNACSAERQ